MGGRGELVIAAAWTGITTLLLPEGKTIYRTFGLPINLTDISKLTVPMLMFCAKLLS